MRAILAALEEGRLIELPDPDKKDSLTLLASLIEAVPGIPPNARIVESIFAREAQANTYLGFGIACPHARTPEEGELLCAIGWSPQGILYGNPDATPVRLVILHYIPDSQRNAYLKEISALARAVRSQERYQDWSPLGDLNSVRLRLLDVVASGLGAVAVEARARMIQIEARPAAPVTGPLDPARVVPAWIVRTEEGRLITLARDEEATRFIDAQGDLSRRLSSEPVILLNGFAVHVRQVSAFGRGRELYDCIVIKPEKPVEGSQR